MRADFTQKFYVIQAAKPVCVVNHQSFPIGKIQELANLFFKLIRVLVYLLDRHHLTHICLSAWVADHTCTAAYQSNGTMTCPLHMSHSHKRDEMTDMEAVRRRIKSNIERDFLFFQHLAQAFVCYLFYKSSLTEDVVSISHAFLLCILYFFSFNKGRCPVIQQMNERRSLLGLQRRVAPPLTVIFTTIF